MDVKVLTSPPLPSLPLSLSLAGIESHQGGGWGSPVILLPSVAVSGAATKSKSGTSDPEGGGGGGQL